MKKFEVSFPYFLEYPVKVAIKRLGLLGFFGWIFQKYGKRLIRKEDITVTERILEVPSVYLLLGPRARPGQKILEIGHVNSSLSLELASLGFQVTGIDLRPYPFTHRNLTSIAGDFLKWEFTERFDWIISVSTIEHFGQNVRYGGTEAGSHGLDAQAFATIRNLLAPDGRFILTVPYAGEDRTDTWFKTYTRASLAELLGQFFRIESERYYVRSNNEWREATPADDPVLPYDGVAIFLLSAK